MTTVAIYDTKPYDREYVERAPEANRLRRQFHEFGLNSVTAANVDGAQLVDTTARIEALKAGRLGGGIN